MLIYFNLLSYLMILVCGKEIPKPKSILNDLMVIASQEQNIFESPSSYKRYQQNNGYNEDGGLEPEPYMFNFDIQDNDNNKQFRKEESNGNTVRGSYGYIDANGLYRTVEYTADSEHGFLAKIKTNEPGMDYYTDNGRSQSSIFPANVIFEVAETPRNLQYSSSDQIANSYFMNEGVNRFNRPYSKDKVYQQKHTIYNGPDKYVTSNINDNQRFERNLINEKVENQDKEQKKSSSNNANYINLQTISGKGFDYQSVFSDGHPVYLESKPSKPMKSITMTGKSMDKNSIVGELLSDHNIDSSDLNNKISMIENLKFNNKTILEREDDLKHVKKTQTDLELKKQLQRRKSIQQIKPFNEIREKSVREHPRRFTGFVNNFVAI